MYIKTNLKGYITDYAIKGGIVDGVEVPETYFKYLNNDKLGYLKFDGLDNPPIFDEEKYNKDEQNNLIEKLRIKRESECFPIINRGKLWYDTLTPEQAKELEIWYKAWLDVTDTLEVPTKPDWII